MSLVVTTKEKKAGVFVISPVGSLDTRTYSILEKKVDYLLASSPMAMIFDMELVDYISSMGVRVILKAKKLMKRHSGYVLLINLQPQIQKVFDIIKALPSQQIFSTIEELDAYLDEMQKTD